MDGAYVLESKDTYYANPVNPRHLAWQAFTEVTGRNEGGIALYYTRKDSRFHIPRRWKTAIAAMKAVDREHPLAKRISLKGAKA